MADSDSLSDDLNEEDLANVSSGDDSSEGAEKPVVMGRVDYKGQNSDQLTFKKGDRILVLGAAQNGWFKGRLESNYDEGLVPATYVVPVETEESKLLAAGKSPNTQKKENDVIVLVVKCLQDFVAKDPSHLSFKNHDRIEILDQSDPLWWKARAKGKIGLVSSKMVEEDKGYTIRRASALKEQTRGQFRKTREKETSARVVTRKSDTQVALELEALKIEQEKLQAERDKLHKEQEAKKLVRAERKASSFSERLAQKTKSAGNVK